MASSINADNGVVSGSSGLKSTADTSGVLALQSNGTTGLTLNTSLALGVGSSPSYGSSGQVLTSAGSGAPPTWSTPSSVTYRNVTTTNTDITLTSADGGAYLTVTSTANVNINLPAANALTGSRTIVMKNIGNFAMLVYDNAGNYLFPLAPNYGVTCWASVATTAAGTWTLGELPPDYICPSVNVASTTGAGAYSRQSTSPFSSTEVLVAYSIGYDFYVTIATNSSGVLTFSTPQLVLATTSGSSPAIMALSSSLAIMNYGDSSANLYAVAVSISGGTFTAGTPVLVQSAIYGNQMFAMLTSTKVGLSYLSNSSTIKTNVLSISGTTITVGTAATVATDTGTQYFGTCGVTSTMYAITYYSGGNGIKIVQVQNNSGNTASVQTASTQFSNGDSYCQSPVVCMDSSRVLCLYIDASSGYLVGKVLTVSGSGWSFGTGATISSAGNLFRYEICASSSTSFVVGYTDGLPAPVRLKGLTTSGTSITVGSMYSGATNVNQTWYTPWNLQPFQSPSVNPASSSFVSLYVPQNGLYEQPIGVSGTTLTTSYTAYAVTSSAGYIDPSYAYSQIAAFSSTRAVMFAGEVGNDGNTFLTAYLVDYSTTTPTYLSKLQVATYSSYMCVTPLTSTTVVVTYRTPSGTICGNVITMSGTSLSAGAQATINAATTCIYNAVSALSSSTLVAYYTQSTSVQAANVLTVSGTTISVGSPTTVTTEDVNYHCVAGLSATSAIVTNAYRTRILTISGTSISAVSAQQSNNISASQFAIPVPTSATSVVCMGGYSSTGQWFANATVVTISGTTVTYSQQSRTSEIFNSTTNIPVMLSPTRGILFLTQSNMVMSFTITNGLVTFGEAQPSLCYSATGLGTFSVATANYQKAAITAYDPAVSYMTSKQVLSLGAAN